MRTIGIRHRRKQTAEGEARPTMVAIKNDDGIITDLELPDDQAELDFAYKMFPVAWEPVTPEADLTPYRPHHCKWRLLKRAEIPENFPVGHTRQRPIDERWELLTHVPTAYEGLQPADRVAMVMGGSGDRLAASLSRQGDTFEAEVFRVPPFALKDFRGGDSDDLKENDHRTLIAMLEQRPGDFYRLLRRDRDLIRVKERLQLRMDAMKARIACSQRLDQRLIGMRFLSEDGLYPEGIIEDAIKHEKANDEILRRMVEAEERSDRELMQAVRDTSEWEHVFEPITGCGPRIVAGLLAAIGDVRRFEVQPDFTGCMTLEDRVKASNRARSKSKARLKAFCGVHVLRGGKYADIPPEKSFPRKRVGMVANWNPTARQSLYLLADQFNRRPGSHWGEKLLINKQRLRAQHPEPVEAERKVDGKTKKVKMYSDGHIHKMGLWRTLTRFVEWMYGQLHTVATTPPNSASGDSQAVA